MEKRNSEYWEKRIAHNTWKTYNSLEDKNRALLEFYLDASKAVKDELYILAEKYSENGVLTLSELHKQKRLAELTKNYEQIVFDLGKQVEGTTINNMREGFCDTYKNVAVEIGADSFAMPNKKLMNKLLEERWRGDSFSGRLWKNQKKLATGLNDILLTGLQQGKTVTELAVNLHNFMGQGFNNCHRLVRTETMHYLNSATLQRYKDSDVEYVQTWAAQDERRCKVCGSYHGKTYDLEKCPALPFHANCRCTIIPVLDEELIEKHVDKDKKHDIIKSSAVSGARKPDSDEAHTHAEKYYGLVRKSKTDVQKISKTTGYSENEIKCVKNYIFMDKHDLGGKELEYFAPDYMMAESWKRLANGKPEQHDILLIKHELMEKELMSQGMSQKQAHKVTSEAYNYDKEANKFYGKIEKYKKK